MLVSKNSFTGKIVSIKVTSGEEVIARCIEDSLDTANPHIKLVNPLSMVMMQSDDDAQQGMVAFAPWVLGMKDNDVFTIYRQHIMVAVESRADAADQYKQAIGEDITPVAQPRQTQQVSQSASKGGRGR